MTRRKKIELVKELIDILHENGIDDEEWVFEHICYIHKDLIDTDKLEYLYTKGYDTDQVYSICVNKFKNHVEWVENITLAKGN